MESVSQRVELESQGSNTATATQARLNSYSTPHWERAQLAVTMNDSDCYHVQTLASYVLWSIALEIRKFHDQESNLCDPMSVIVHQADVCEL